MKILVCGGRDYEEQDYLFKTLDKFHNTFNITYLIQGGAGGINLRTQRGYGADYMAMMWANARDVPCQTYKANWDKYGRGAGPRRNAQMLNENSDIKAVIAFPGGRGTEDMVNKAKAKGIQVFYVFD